MAAEEYQEAVKLYELAAEDERLQFDRYQKSIAFHFGIVTVILGGTVAGILRATESQHFYFLLSGPALILIAATIGAVGTTRLYMGWLERVTVRAKLEQRLGLTRRPTAVMPGTYWPDEAVVPLRNLRAREQARSSEEFVDRAVHAGYNRWVRILFLCFIVLAIAVAIGLVVVAQRGLT
jgi:hypothetical protein